MLDRTDYWQNILCVCHALYVDPQGATAAVVLPLELRPQVLSSSDGQYLKISLQTYY